MATEAHTVRGRGSVVVFDEAGLLAAPGVPRPGDVGDPVSVGPRHVSIDVAVCAILFADLAGDDRHLLRNVADDRVPAALVATGVSVVDVSEVDMRFWARQRIEILDVPLEEWVDAMLEQLG